MEHKRILAENRRYKIIGNYETVSLIDKTTNAGVIIGDFYGDPQGALIDPDERFAVTYGCGLIVYFLRPPFAEYAYDTQTSQWLELGRSEPVKWVENVLQKSRDEIEIIFENGQTEIINVKNML